MKLIYCYEVRKCHISRNRLDIFLITNDSLNNTRNLEILDDIAQKKKTSGRIETI